ncbi:divisome protein SepX/GlpR [Nocardia araoensis]|uniref:divisome protein SepX/GlpR n=1 Tax=Nocardia araoensis TaxID=228600 RepID=UPI000306B155|nr:gephyrin-like molybdotransferase receptor GlpR [Nocardia araoensis]
MPNSILWIGLVVLWVFVLFPILADRHPRIRRTTDAALATRVLHRGGGKRRLKKGPAAGHETDPNWRPRGRHDGRRVPREYPHSDDAEDRMTTPADEPVTETDEENTSAADDAAVSDIADAEPDDTEVDDFASAATEEHEADGDEMRHEAPDDDEADEVAAKIDAGADDDRVGAHHPEPVAARIPPARSTAPAVVDYDEYDDYDDADPDEPDFVPSRRGRGGFDPEADAIARAARYTFRQRAVLGLLLAALLFGALAFVFTPMLWWGCGLAVTVLATYLAYLRKQVRMEEEIRRRRAARLHRGHQGEADPRARRGRAPGGTMDRDTARAIRRRSTLVDPDDEDPMFAHLDPFDPATARALRTRAGRDMRRAAGA